MKNKLLITFLLLCLNTFGQYPNLSGKWTGTITYRDKSTAKFNLDISIKDECNLQYYVIQREEDRRTGICKYIMFQSKNTVIRSPGTMWVDNKTESSGPASELKLTYKDNKLIGYRLGLEFDSTNNYNLYKHFITLTRKTESSFLSKCTENDTSKTCIKLEDKLPENVFDKQLDSSQVYLKILDNNTEDGDKVTVFLNENKLLNQAPIYKNLPYCIPLSIKGSNIISWCSCNNGIFGKNTGKIIIEEYLHKDLVQLKEYDIILDKNQQYKILIY